MTTCTTIYFRLKNRLYTREETPKIQRIICIYTPFVTANNCKKRISKTPSLKHRLQQVVNQELNTISDKTHAGNRGVDSRVFVALYGSKRAIWGEILTLEGYQVVTALELQT